MKKSTGPQTGLDNFFQKQARSILESPWEIVQVFHIFIVIMCLFTNFNLLSANLTKWFDHRQKPTNSLLKPSSPENNRKHLVSLYFHGHQKEILGKNGLAHLFQTLIEYFRDKKTSKFFSLHFPMHLNAGRKLNVYVHKTSQRRPRCLLNVLCSFNLRPVSRGKVILRHWKKSWKKILLRFFWWFRTRNERDEIFFFYLLLK